MPISILPQDKDGQELFNAISSFFHTFGIGKLLRQCNAQKEKGVPVLDADTINIGFVVVDACNERCRGNAVPEKICRPGARTIFLSPSQA